MTLDTRPARLMADASSDAGSAVSEATGSETEHVSIAGAESQRALPDELLALQARLAALQDRQINLHDLASVLSAVRFHPLRQTSSGASIPGNRQLVDGIKQADLDKWYRALGIQPEQVIGMKSAAFWAGLSIPTSSTIFNALNYVVLPFATRKLGNPWAAAGLSAALVSLQPVLTSPVQSFVIGMVDYHRRWQQPEIKLDKSVVTSVNSHAEIKAKIDQSIEQIKRSGQSVAERLATVGLDACHGSIDAGELKRIVEAHPALVAEAQAHLEDFMQLCARVTEMHGVDSAHARQIESTLMQIAPRAFRAGSGILSPFLRKAGSAAPYSAIGGLIPRKLESLGVTGVAVAIASVAMAAQHVAAAFDEVKGLELEHKLNMLHANLVKRDRQEHVARDGKITADDLDLNACKEMIQMPEQWVVSRVAGQLDAKVKKMEAQLARSALTEGSVAELSAAEEGQAPGDPALHAKIDAYKTDMANLRNGSLRPDMHEDTQALLQGALLHTKDFLVDEGVAKVTKPLEFSSQVSQRLGQTFTLGALGGAGATAGGRIVSAALGGNERISLTVQLVLSVISAIVGIFAAATQGMVVNVKNQRRDAKHPDQAMGFWTQTGKGAIAPVLWNRNRHTSRRGLDDASAALQALQHNAGDYGRQLQLLADIAATGAGAASDRAADARRINGREAPSDTVRGTRREPSESNIAAWDASGDDSESGA